MNIRLHKRLSISAQTRTIPWTPDEENAKIMYIDQGHDNDERIITRPEGVGREA